jgi:hypothetical protein
VKKNKAKAAAKAKAKLHKLRVLKVEKLAAEKHLVAFEAEVHGPEDALPEFTAPVEITEESIVAKKMPEHSWYDSLCEFFQGW